MTGVLWRSVSIVNPRSARSQSEPQYVIFSDPLGERRQSYGMEQCWQMRMCGTSMAASLVPKGKCLGGSAAPAVPLRQCPGEG